MIIRNAYGEDIDTAHIDLVTKKLDRYTDEENIPRSREYRLLSELRHPGNPYRSKAGKT
jgi:hypothetical protein